MNIFKVMASGKRRLNEENMSACLAWLLHPGMDHGFGPTFLKSFLTELADYTESTDPNIKEQLKNLGKRIQLKLRSRSDDDLSIQVELEHNANELGFVDVVVNIKGEWVIGIENKISAASAQNTIQLLSQYRGLLEEGYGEVVLEGQEKPAEPKGQRLMVFLVPSQRGDNAENVLEKSVMAEWNELPLIEMYQRDAKVLVTWKASTNHPSIERVLTKMLEDESSGSIDPFNDQSRHTLLSLRRFIISDFEGYPFSKESAAGGKNPATEDRYDLSTLRKKLEGFVGVQYGVSGLLRYLKDQLIDRQDFQFTRKNMERERNWLPLKNFLAVVQAAQNKFPNIDAVLSCSSNDNMILPGDILCWLAEQENKPIFFVGISGGANKLASMTRDDIAGKKWGVASNMNTSQWIVSSEFANLYRQAEQRE